MLSCKFYKIFKNTPFTEHRRVTAFVCFFYFFCNFGIGTAFLITLLSFEKCNYCRSLLFNNCHSYRCKYITFYNSFIIHKSQFLQCHCNSGAIYSSKQFKRSLPSVNDHTTIFNIFPVTFSLMENALKTVCL